jgi:hypothetical protein
MRRRASSADASWYRVPDTLFKIMVGWGIGVVMNAWDVYWRPEITENDIRHEVEREHSRG